MDPRRTLLSEKHQGTLAEYVIVPTGNVLPKPPELTFAEAACLPTAWLTAYRMLFVRSGLRPGQTVLVQGASGGVASACITPGPGGGPAGLGDRAHRGEAAGRAAVRRPRRVRLRRPAARTGRCGHGDGRRGDLVAFAALAQARRAMVISGATSGFQPDGDRAEPDLLPVAVDHRLDDGHPGRVADLMALLVATGLRPHIDRTLPLDQVGDGLRAMESGTTCSARSSSSCSPATAPKHRPGDHRRTARVITFHPR